MLSPLFCSVFKEGKVYFGGYPSKEMFEELIRFGVTCFVDLTTRFEKQHLSFVYSYPNKLSFPIRDNSIPYNTDAFRRFIVHLADVICRHKGKIYIHCKGGHNRSGLLISSLFCFMDNIEPMNAMAMTAARHTARIQMKEKYKNVPCPDNYRQRQFVIDLFNPIIICKSLFTNNVVYSVLDFVIATEIRPILTDNGASSAIIMILLDLRRQLYSHELENNKKKYINRKYHADTSFFSSHLPRFLKRSNHYSPKIEH
jgi:hypothetical protein